jgi:hypothetical protein
MVESTNTAGAACSAFLNQLSPIPKASKSRAVPPCAGCGGMGHRGLLRNSVSLSGIGATKTNNSAPWT